MCVRQVRDAVMTLGAALGLFIAPAQSYALFDWLCPASGSYRGTAVTSYTPPFTGRPVAWAPRYSEAPWRPAAPVVATRIAPAATTCCYVPATFYRTEYRMAPATTCQAVSYYDPSSGCPMVTYRPVTSWAYRPQVVPYNTYRIVYAAPATTCAAAPSPAYGVAVPSAVSQPGCASCNRTAPASSVISPIPSSSATVFPPSSLPGPLPTTSPLPAGAAWPGGASTYGAKSPLSGAPSTSGGVPTATLGLPVPVPASSTSPSTSPGPVAPETRPGPTNTLDKGNPPSSQERLKPTPDSNTGPEPAKMPDLGTPQGRTAQRMTVRPAVYVQPVSSRSQAGPPVPPRLDTSGWEAAGN